MNNKMTTCQYCGAALEPEAATCPMCGSPVTPPVEAPYDPDHPPYTVVPPDAVLPKPTVETPSQPTLEAPPEPVYAPQPEDLPPAPVFAPPAVSSNKLLAVVVEIAAGIFGFLGIGWLISGKWVTGIILLVGYWIVLAIYVALLVFLIPFTVGLSLGGLCLTPIVPIISGVILNNSL